jgi:8-hydroxy-5-deazaflavin:NADPH oxidoreductase
MKVSVIGSGNMGAALAGQLAKAGHDVALTSRNAVTAAAVSGATGATVVPASRAAEADVIILATSAPDAAAALLSVGDLKNKVVVDITNPLTADYMGLTIGHSTSSAEEIAKAVPGVRLVKGFNTVFAQLLGAGAALPQGGKVAVFLASDDAAAKATVAELAGSMGFAVTDAGPLKNARYLEPLAGLNIYLGYGAGLGTAISPTWVSAV